MKKSVLETLAYFDIFDYPLTSIDLSKFLWRDRWSEDCLENKFEKYFFLNGKEKNIHSRLKNEKISKHLWKKVLRYVGFLQMFPFIKMVSVCNNLAYNNTDDKSDIDLFIVIEKNRLWSTRLFITFLFQILGVRRHGKKIAGKFCLSFFVTEDALKISDLALHDEDVYLTYWMATIVPVLDYFGTYQRFLDVNRDYLGKNLPNFVGNYQKEKIITDSKFFIIIQNILKFLLNNKIGDFLEKILKKILKKRALKKFQKLDSRSGVIISDTVLKFHDVDRRGEYYDRWKEKSI